MEVEVGTITGFFMSDTPVTENEQLSKEDQSPVSLGLMSSIMFNLG